MNTIRLSDLEYQQRTQKVLSAIEAQIDIWLEEDLIDVDSHRSGGLLELAFPNGSKIILNTQPPLQELWMAARAGGFHYRFDGKVWSDTRDGTEFFDNLSRQASAQGAKVLTFNSPV